MQSLLEMADSKDFDGVLAAYRQCPVGEVVQAADRLREDDIYNVAIDLYRWLLDNDESSHAHFGLGQCYGKIYDYDRALTHLDRAFELDPDRSDGASYYAYILERHERMDDAERWYRQAIEGVEADNLWARSHYAWFLEKWGRIEDAYRAYDDVLERNPGYTWAVKRYALLLRAQGEESRAESLMRQAVDTNPENRFALLNYLEFLLLAEDHGGYEAFRAGLDPSGGPAWYPVVVELFDYYREHLLPGEPDPARLARWEDTVDGLTDSVHRDFDDLSALLDGRGGDVNAWKAQLQLLLK